MFSNIELEDLVYTYPFIEDENFQDENKVKMIVKMSDGTLNYFDGTNNTPLGNYQTKDLVYFKRYWESYLVGGNKIRTFAIFDKKLSACNNIPHNVTFYHKAECIFV